jgi:hypothetical protein
MSNDDYETLEVVVKFATAKAVLVWCNDLEHEHWIPKSCIHADDAKAIGPERDSMGDQYDIRVKAWMMRKLEDAS